MCSGCREPSTSLRERTQGGARCPQRAERTAHEHERVEGNALHLGLQLGFRVVAALVFGAVSLRAQPGTPNPKLETDAPSPRVLRVAADPNNLPFSNERREGFENRIAELIARELGAELQYVWWPQRRGFFRETLGEGRADAVMGVTDGFERVATTQPYYRSTYVFVRRRGAPRVRSFDDPALRELTVGVQMIGDDFYNTPPAHALSRRGLINNVRGFTVYGDYARDSPSADVVRAVANERVDVAVVWGPTAGYFATREAVPLEIEPVEPEQDGPLLPFTYAIAVGVRRGNEPLQREIDAVLDRKREEITKILDAFGVPRLPLPSSAEEVPNVAAK